MNTGDFWLLTIKANLAITNPSVLILDLLSCLVSFLPYKMKKMLVCFGYPVHYKWFSAIFVSSRDT